MDYTVEQISQNNAADLCREIAADLPDYFGLPEVNEHYAQGMLSRLSLAAKIDYAYAGMITIEFPYSGTANIYWLGVKLVNQGSGIGKLLIQAVEQQALAQSAKFLTVETLSPKKADENYLKTFRFYEKCGFQPLFDLQPEGYKHSMVYMAKHLPYKN